MWPSCEPGLFEHRNKGRERLGLAYPYFFKGGMGFQSGSRKMTLDSL